MRRTDANYIEIYIIIYLEIEVLVIWLACYLQYKSYIVNSILLKIKI